MNVFKSILHIIWMILLPFAIANGIWYLLGAFVAWDWNPMNWWLLTNPFGRVLAVLLEISIFANIPKFWEAFE
jgi:hypothetical protein